MNGLHYIIIIYNINIFSNYIASFILTLYSIEYLSQRSYHWFPWRAEKDKGWNYANEHVYQSPTFGTQVSANTSSINQIAFRIAMEYFPHGPCSVTCY